MVDRVTCELRIIGEKPSEALVDIIDRLEGEEESFIPPRFKGQQFTFEGVSNGDIDPDLDRLLRHQKISYIWRYGASIGFTAGVEIYNATTDEWVNYDAIDGDIALKIDSIEADPSIVLTAKAWKDFVNERN